MFYKKKIENLWILSNGRHEYQNKKNKEYEWADIELSKQIKETNERIDTLLQMIEGHDKLLQQLIPTINKQTQKYKKLEENYQMLVKVVEKIVTKIDPEWKSKTVNINKAKKGK